ncbi:hypothetical protein Pflav_029310 [Phytohabitans flavus]|uniref:Histidine kinase domain-containing protein n=1 Tax=Phytohabitans flavus TaxID=1076124 RepID=A0A6F8XRZ8_9ACTN|nr:hypothetical protein Pflav_029310 [Phytohabitans flavus]
MGQRWQRHRRRLAGRRRHLRGIPEADLPRVFDIAFRGERARTPRGIDGAVGGLGLAIVRGLVEAHGGRVDAHNIPNGCRFVVHLPAAP